MVLEDAEDVIEHWTWFISASSDTRRPSFPEPTNLLPEAEVPGADVDNKLIYTTFSILCFMVVFWQEINFLFLVYIIGRASNYSTDRSPTTLTFCFFFDWARDTRLFHRPCHGFQPWVLSSTFSSCGSCGITSCLGPNSTVNWQSTSRPLYTSTFPIYPIHLAACLVRHSRFNPYKICRTNYKLQHVAQLRSKKAKDVITSMIWN